MNDQVFRDEIRRRLLDGQQQLAAITRSLVAEADPRLPAILEAVDDIAFLEPTLFALLHAPSERFPLEQCLFGYLDDEHKPPRATVHSSVTGCVYLPNVGCFETGLPDSALELRWHGAAADSTLRARGRPVRASFHPIDRLGDSSIEVYRSLPPPFAPFFRGPQGLAVDVEVECTAAAGRALLEEAFRVLRQQAPEYCRDLLTGIRGVLVYDAAHAYSFATMAAHGVAFLNASAQPTAVSFLEDLIHQSAHVIFNSATIDKEELFAVDPARPLSEITDLDDYHGSLYGAFHGLFTQLNINRCLRDCHFAGLFAGAAAHELQGRISDDMKRFGTAIHALGRRPLYTRFGWSVFEYFRSAFIALYHEMRDLIEGFDTSNQPYVFSYERFLERNPPPEPTAAPR